MISHAIDPLDVEAETYRERIRVVYPNADIIVHSNSWEVFNLPEDFDVTVLETAVGDAKIVRSISERVHELETRLNHVSAVALTGDAAKLRDALQPIE